MREYKYPLMVGMLGVMLIIFIHAQIRDEIFISQDGGMKTLMIKEYLADNYSNTFAFASAPKWAHELWNEGLFSFRRPFVYDTPIGKTSVFPPFFSMLSTPFYKAFGFHGLYIIPALSLVLLWVLFVYMSKHIQTDMHAITMTLIVFVFGSALTFYASVFWEHTLAALLSFVGLIWIVMSEKNSISAYKAAFFGICIGISTWLRPEATMVVTPIFLIALHQFWIKRNPSTLVFIVAAVASVSLFLLYNYITYGSPTGLHSRQITDKSFFQRAPEIIYIFAVLAAKTILYDPVVVFVVAASVFFRKAIIEEIKNGKFLFLYLCLVVIIFFFSSPLILPNTGGNNWGIRYALVVTPFIYFMAAMLLKKSRSHRYRRMFLALFIILLAYGFMQNSVRGTFYLFENYNGAKANAIAYLKAEQPDILLVTRSYQASEFETLMPRCLFFQTDTNESFGRFLSTPEIKGKKILLLIDEADERANLKRNNPQYPLKLKLADYKEIVDVATFGGFKIYAVNPPFQQ